MTARRLTDYLASQDPVFRLPHPYLTAYYVQNGHLPGLFSLKAHDTTTPPGTVTSAPSVSFTEPEDLKSGDRPDDSNNTAWARARRSPLVFVSWGEDQHRLLTGVWLVVYTIFTIRPSE